MGAGFVLASKGHIDIWLFLATLVGLSAVIASACVCNNYIDRHADKMMERTKERARVTGQISPRNALLFALFLGVLGIGVLALFTNALTCLLRHLVLLLTFFCIASGNTAPRIATEIGSFAVQSRPLWVIVPQVGDSTGEPSYCSSSSLCGRCPIFSRLPSTAVKTMQRHPFPCHP